MAHFIGSSKNHMVPITTPGFTGLQWPRPGVRLAVVLRPRDPARVLRWASRAAVPEAPGATGAGPCLWDPFFGMGNLWKFMMEMDRSYRSAIVC